jgi:CCR4-NOT complex subunit CAF16
MAEPEAMPKKSPAIRIRELTFAYRDETEPVFDRISLEIPAGSRTLLIGANGTGKSTLLRLIAGHHLVPADAIQVLGGSPFHQPPAPGELALVDGDFPLDVDLRVSELLDYGSAGVDRAQQAELMELLGVKPAWRMCRVSDGQRRRVQCLLALRKPVKVLLLDEITANLDLMIRADLTAWLRQRSVQHGLTVLYATHILDGLWVDPTHAWPTHIAFLSFARPPFFAPVTEIPELAAGPGQSATHSPLFKLCEDWIRRDFAEYVKNLAPGTPLIRRT